MVIINKYFKRLSQKRRIKAPEIASYLYSSTRTYPGKSIVFSHSVIALNLALFFPYTLSAILPSLRINFIVMKNKHDFTVTSGKNKK